MCYNRSILGSEYMKVGFLKPDNTVDYMEYYEVEKYCMKKIKEYVSISKENFQEFELFSKQYTYFKPYFDFVMVVLKYTMINPLYESGKKIYYDGSNLKSSLIEKSNQYDNIDQSLMFDTIWGYLCDDHTLCIQPANSNDFNNSFIDYRGINIGSMYALHDLLFPTIWNQYLIDSVSLVSYFGGERASLLLNRASLVRYLGLLQVTNYGKDTLNFLVYNSMLYSEEQRKIVEYVKEYRAYEFTCENAFLSRDEFDSVKSLVKGMRNV